MKKRWIFLVLGVAWLPWLIAAWDNTIPADSTQWNQAAGQIRANWDALEVVLGTDLDLGVTFTPDDIETDSISADTVDVDTLTSAVSPWIDVTHSDYGATGNGSDDDTTAIQAALDFGKANSGSTVYFPSGTYKVTFLTLANASNMKILGNGIGQIKIETTASIKGSAATDRSMFFLDTATDVIVDGIEFVGNETEFVNDGLDTKLVLFNAATRCVIRDCKVSKIERGIEFEQDSTDCRIENNIATECFAAGIRTDGEDASNPNTYFHILGNTSYNNRDDSYGQGEGIHTNYAAHFIISNNICYDNMANGIRHEGSVTSVLTGNVCRANGSNGISMYLASSKNVITGNMCINNNTNRHGDVDTRASKGNSGTEMAGIQLENVSNNCTVIGNVCGNDSGSFQGYGIVSNLRNFGNRNTSSEKNIITLNSCFGNIYGQIEDRSKVNFTGFNVTSLAGSNASVVVFNHTATPPSLKFSAAPAAGDWPVNARTWDTDIAASADPGWIPTTTGTFGSLAGITGTTADTTSILLPNSLTGLSAGNYVDVVGSDYQGARILKVPAALGSTTVDASSASGQKVLNVTATASFAIGDTIIIDRGTSDEEAIIVGITAGVSFTLQANLGATYTTETVEVVCVMDAVESSQVSGAAVTYTTPVMSPMANID